ncbi:exported hypothetical protein [Rhodospirillaceae bacterium LM-1]|nr:exported hypothetical protein [Rhodospirillaceae bacterium LM-1]
MTNPTVILASLILACGPSESLAGPKGLTTGYDAVFNGEMFNRSTNQSQEFRLVLRQNGERLEGETDDSASGPLKGWRRNGMCSLKGRVGKDAYLVLLGDCTDLSYSGNFTQVVEGASQEGVFKLEAVSGRLKPTSARK